MDILVVTGIIAITVLIVLLFYMISFVNKATKLIEDTRNQINKQSEQFTETIEKIDLLVADVHKFVNLATDSMQKVSDISEKLSNLVNKVDSKADNLLVVIDEIAQTTKTIYEKVNKPVRSIVEFFSNFSENISFVKSLLPKKKQA